MMTDTLSLPINRGLATEIAARLQAAILNGQFQPGERLREEVLAETMGVSRGPIREAFLQLERQGLIIIRRNRGAFVARLSHEDVDEVYTLRLALERLAVQRAIEFADGTTFDQMQLVVNTMADYVARGITEQEAALLDLQFHDIMYWASRHQRLYEYWTNLKPQIHILFLSRNVADPGFREVMVDGHQEILDALRSHDVPRCVALTERHLKTAYERVIGSYHEWSNNRRRKDND